jgi:superfamily II DNA or RNA helicase
VILRSYQKQARDSILSEWKENNSTLLVLPTGSGKTLVFSEIIRARFPGRAMVLAHRQELIWQAKEKIQAITGLATEVEMGEFKSSLSTGLFRRAHVVVSTIQTHCAGGDGGGRMGKFDPNDFRTLIVDEAHHATSPSYRRVIEYYRTNPKLKVLGVTATPDRADEEALGQVFETVAYDYEILDAIHDGWLVPIKQQMVDVQGLDFSSVRPTAGDLNGADLASIMETERNLHGVAGPSIDIIGDKRTLVFTASVKHAEMLAAIFNRHRPDSAAWVCGKTDKHDRALINDGFNSGKIQILCNCGTHTEGFDSPGVEIVIMAKPTKSRSLYAQMVGRSTRPLPGVVDGLVDSTAETRRERIANSKKPSCLVVDFAGNSGRHKLMTTADILGGKVSDVAIERAIAIAKKSGRPVQMDALLDEEEEQFQREAEQRRLEEEARRAKLVAKAKFSLTSVDPFDILQVKPVASRGWDKGKVLSEKQRNFLRRGGIDPDKINYANAKALIGEMMNRFEKHLCTLGQAKVLRKFGCPTDLTFEQASKTIDAIAKNGWRRPENLSFEPAEMATVADDNIPF